MMFIYRKRGSFIVRNDNNFIFIDFYFVTKNKETGQYFVENRRRRDQKERRVQVIQLSVMRADLSGCN